MEHTQPFLRANPSRYMEHFSSSAREKGASSRGHVSQQGRRGHVDFSALCSVKLRSVLVLLKKKRGCRLQKINSLLHSVHIRTCKSDYAVNVYVLYLRVNVYAYMHTLQK